LKELLREFSAEANERVAKLLELRDAGGVKIVEHTGSFCPEELIYAAGARAYLMCRGGDPEPAEAVLEYLLRVMNPYVRTMAGQYLMGIDTLTENADLVVFQETDCQIGRVSELMEYLKLPVYKLGVPVDWKKDISYEYYVRALEKFKAKLEELTGTVVDDEKLLPQIKRQNRINALLREIDGLRKTDNPPITGYDFIRLCHYTFFVDPERAIGYLERALVIAKSAAGAYAAPRAPRILLAGHVVAVGDYVVPMLIEESGGAIVCEMLDEGVRHFRHDVSTEGDLVRNIAHRNYYEKLPPDIFQPAYRDRFEIMKKLVADYRVDGVVWYQLVFDEIYDMEAACVGKWLREMNVPFLKLESSYEYSREAMGPLKTRIESFVGSVKRQGGKNE
jgi:benzoyl-CoA reductase/2-hydroxyglutaryl-CoA dehydratase subunit BcrC/BadD/HgdB